MLLTENHETLIRMASEQAAFAIAVENGQFDFTNESVMEGNSSTSLCRSYAEPRNSLSLRLQTVLIDHVKIEPLTGIVVFKICKNFRDSSTSAVATTRK